MKTYFIVFGGVGDLAKRKIFPAFCRMQLDNRLSNNITIIGIGRRDLNDAQYRKEIGDELMCRNFTENQKFSKKQIEGILPKIEYCKINFDNPEDFCNLKAKVGKGGQLIHYFAIHSKFYASVCRQLSTQGLTENARIVLEKPIGEDQQSAKKINTELKEMLTEKQIFRIDHYLGKESVQNLFALRFGNTIFETIWNRNNIACVEISICEAIGIENRGDFYDQTGAMRDMVQGHLLQLLSIIGMDAPLKMEADFVRDEKVKVLRALRPISQEIVRENTIRGQYMADDESPGYLQSLNVKPNSHTESFVALKCWVDNWRWAGVPFYLRTGKRLNKRLGQIIIHFNQVPHALFASQSDGENQLVIGLNPVDELNLKIMTKVPGDSHELGAVRLNFDFSEYFNSRPRDAYERLLNDIIIGDLTLFVRDDEVDVAWHWADQIIEGWQGFEEDIYPYKSGGWGPSRKHDFINKEGFQWHESLAFNADKKW